MHVSLPEKTGSLVWNIFVGAFLALSFLLSFIAHASDFEEKIGGEVKSLQIEFKEFRKSSDPLRSRIAVLESEIHHLRDDISEMKIKLDRIWIAVTKEEQ